VQKKDKILERGTRHEIVVSGEHDLLPGSQEGVFVEQGGQTRWRFWPTWQRVLEPSIALLIGVAFVVLIVIWAYFAYRQQRK
jgi:hypothetical protein